MVIFYIYTNSNKLVGYVTANDWIDARQVACKTFGYNFGDIWASQTVYNF